MSGAPTTVLVLGGTGMLGHTLFERLAEHEELDVHATVRNATVLEGRTPPGRGSVHAGIDASRIEPLEQVMADVAPSVVINAIGIVRQVPAASDPVASMEINARLPHQLAAMCAGAGARLVHIGTDCVFSGARGGYTELDTPDPTDLYGRSKLLGEPSGGALTLRTSLIGHELRTRHGLLEWFLAQSATASGFRRAIFSGLTTLELARVLADVVLPRPDLTGVFHLSSDAISKLEFLELVARRYDKPIQIVPADEPVIDRSLDSSRFRDATGYRPPAWAEQIDAMYEDARRRYPVHVMAPTLR